MKNNFKFLFFAVTLLCSAITLAQSVVTGTVLDPETNAPMPGVNVIEVGTSNGISTDFDGNFNLTTKSSDTKLSISFVGYLSQEFEISGDTNLGEITLAPSEFGLDEVNIIASVAVDRKTPVAVSTIRANEISLKLGTQEFPEVLKSTPGVYATKAGGGYGDGRINLRGFDSENVAVMINGVPVNDMENGRVYWSNWAGLGDVTSSMQVQRGLGASKVAVPSVGGTINIISKTTDVEEGGNVYATLGNDGYEKYGVTYSTGLMDNGFAATVSAAKTDGDGYVDGTEFSAVSYFLNLSKQLGEDHKLSFTAFGAKQRHGQRQTSHTIDTYRDSESGIKFNSDWGYKNGQVTHAEDNFYHKPQISLNHYWDISDKTSLSTAAYVSFGSGGGGGTGGDGTKFALSNSDYRIGELGTIDFDRIVAENEAAGVNGSESFLRASRNDHNWFGVLSTLKTDLTDEIVLLGGLDYRNYKGIHFTEVTDLLGGQYALDNSNVNNPNNQAQVGDKIFYDNDGKVNWFGAFAQAEYSKDKLSAFVSLSASNTAYKRVDRFLYLDTDPLQETDAYNFFGYGAKGGVNYNINENHNVFVNLGYFEKAPYFNSVFASRNNVDVNEDAENQKITSFELGYGFRGEKLSANINVYHTKWNDRTEVASFQLQDGTRAFANILGVNALHKGVEVDLKYKATDNLTITGMASLGDWRWDNNIEGVEILDETNTVVQTVDIIIEDLHVGDAAQTTLALGTNYKLTPETTFTIDYNYFDDLYAQFDPSDRGEAGPDAWKVPAYGIFDTAIRHGFSFGSFDATITGRINNVFDTEYIADAQDGGDSTFRTARVYYGFGRTFSVGMKLNF
ncbi:TonB-dependent receptor domain-containing protein [Lacinutrix sp. 5H-3-7-4]|uniref:TonB-dependent receptor n=1 Tax=Lacinutrix sp. (strain 5H-3-7-4) TaxID=983544 RepID=UPI00020A33AB|nr:TonB-dependent receptor [Lacinutrix sp. 5H-3-7-4]AEH00656.1 TonB-dependent receptor plug [Lacinutrix sp. 5H-3-7-4]